MTMPTMRVEIDSMRYQVVHAFNAHQREIEEALDEACKRALNDFNIEDLAYRHALSLLEQCVKDSVKHAIANQVSREITRRFRQAFPEEGT